MTPFFTTFPRNLSFIEIEVLCDKKKKSCRGGGSEIFPLHHERLSQWSWGIIYQHRFIALLESDKFLDELRVVLIATAR